tara:strand:- start:710 stop:934 length:225 start_codon:yes stop_codon:yes gene_type:complete
MQIKKIIDIITNKIEKELNDEGTMKKLNEKIFVPIINNLFIQMYPYFIFISIIIICLFILLFTILILHIKSLYK